MSIEDKQYILNATFKMSTLNRGRKMDMVDLQNATLSGGVAVGAIADLMVHFSDGSGYVLLKSAYPDLYP